MLAATYKLFRDNFMKRIVFIIILLFIEICVFAQQPDWQWVAHAGGSARDHGQDITIDDMGNIFIVGSFEENIIFDPYTLTSNGLYDIFIAKIDESGNWIWADNVFGNYDDHGIEICNDPYGNLYITGFFNNSISFGSTELISNGSRDIFIAKLNQNNEWEWAKNAGGIEMDIGYGICSDSEGNAYITGIFRDTASFGSINLTSCGETDVFIAKLDVNGNWLWVNEINGSDLVYGIGICTDSNNNIYATGSFQETATFGPFSLTSSGDNDVFVSKMSSDGNWIWVNCSIASLRATSKDIIEDTDGNVYIIGSFVSDVSFGDINLSSVGWDDVFVAKIDEYGNWIWANKAGGISIDFGNGICIDNLGNLYITGSFYSYAIYFGDLSVITEGWSDIFIAKMDNSGNWIWVESAGSSGSDSGQNLISNSNGNVYLTGSFLNTAYFGDYEISSFDEQDIFVANLSENCSIENNIIVIDNARITNYPNPFNPNTTIEFNILNHSNVELAIYNIKGQKIISLANNVFAKGSHFVVWNGLNESGDSVSSGIYLYKLNVNGKNEAMKKCLLLK